MRQAALISPEDPDVRFNKGAIEGLLGHFGNAACDFLAAYEVDQKRLKGTRQMLENHLTVLRRAESQITTSRQTGKRPFASLLAKLPSFPDAVTINAILNGSVTSPCHVTVGVVDILSENSMEPLVVLAAEKSGEFLLLLFYGLVRGAIKLTIQLFLCRFRNALLFVSCTRCQISLFWKLGLTNRRIRRSSLILKRHFSMESQFHRVCLFLPSSLRDFLCDLSLCVGDSPWHSPVRG
ncbi:hypothetical protein C3747_104g127 [Trypanosoma cruzi]|uniref:Uncharacterized protein n=1 Tax=Trypanosoma cruzi TaxID=5693 RepID=A0A2V2WKY4_TRYCR|nr:hypothetical protein C3747_104g127 [Trypanosoma cruzi]